MTELVLRQRPQVVLDTSTNVATLRHDDGTLSVANGWRPVGPQSNVNDDQLTAQHQRRAVRPGSRDMGGQHPLAFPGNPGHLTPHETSGFGARSSTRNRHPNRSVVPDSHDVASGAPHTDELDREVRWMRFDRWGAKKRKIELHGWRGPMITHTIAPDRREVPEGSIPRVWGQLPERSLRNPGTAANATATNLVQALEYGPPGSCARLRSGACNGLIEVQK